MKTEDADTAENEEWLECISSTMDSISSASSVLKQENSPNVGDEFSLERWLFMLYSRLVTEWLMVDAV